MKRLIFASVTLFTVFLLVSCQKEIHETDFTGKALGTTYHIRIQGDGADISRKEIEQLIADLNQSLSTYISGSLISRINRGEKLKADTHFRYVFEQAAKVYKETDGIFDPTVGILVNAWGFGPGKKMKGIEKDSSLVDSLLQYVGFDRVKIDAAGYVFKENPGIYFDFNAIAKGYVIDKIGELIASKGYNHYLVELGGEVLARGKNIKENRPWTVAIDYPVPGSNSYAAAVVLKDNALATSGNYRKYRIDKQTGRKYVHTINPLTGYPAQSELLSASVMAPNCTLADAWATACMASGLEKSKKYILQHKDLEGLLIYSDPNGKLQIWKSEGIKIIKLY
jgi:thiamine biosynthesis lipoprotein